MALMDKRFHLASLTIASAYRGIRVRRSLTQLLRRRKWAISLIQQFVRLRMERIRDTKAKTEAALLIQRQIRGYFVNKKYAKQLGDISIFNTLKPFRDMKQELGTLLSNKLRL